MPEVEDTSCREGIVALICWGDTKASSASFSVTRWLKSFGFDAVTGEVASNSNLAPLS
jgi:hypothetical protein